MTHYVTSLLSRAPTRIGKYAIDQVFGLPLRIYIDPREGPRVPPVDLGLLLRTTASACVPTAPAVQRAHGPLKHAPA